MTALTRYSNQKLLKLPDCDGLLENGKCSWLDISVCVGADCSFCHKIGSLTKVWQRLRSLDEQTQEHIAQKYYEGSRPWDKN